MGAGLIALSWKFLDEFVAAAALGSRARGGRRFAFVFSGCEVPEGALVSLLTFDHARACWVFRVEHPSLPEVKLGGQLPILGAGRVEAVEVSEYTLGSAVERGRAEEFKRRSCSLAERNDQLVMRLNAIGSALENLLAEFPSLESDSAAARFLRRVLKGKLQAHEGG